LISDWFGGEHQHVAIFDRLPIVAMAAWMLAAGWSAGMLLLRGMRVGDGLTPLERFVFATGAGLNILSLLTLAMGLLGLLHWPLVFIVPLAGLTIFGAREALQQFREFLASVKNNQARADWSRAVMGIAAGLFTLMILLGALLPPWDFDVREYHLQAPKEWFAQGAITFLPHNVYANMPLGAEMHALLAMCVMPTADGWWWGALVGKTLVAAFAPLTAVALYAVGRRLVSPTAVAIASVVYISHPWVAHVSASGLNDGVVAFYLLVTLYALLLCRDQPRMLLLAGFLAGAAMACKYTSLLFVVAPLTAVLFIFPAVAQRNIRSLAWKACAIFLAVALVGGGLWYAKNLALTDNPTYPLLYTAFDGKTRTPENDRQWTAAHAVPRDADGWRYSPAQLVAATNHAALTSQFASPLVVPFGAAAIICASMLFWRRRTSGLLVPDDNQRRSGVTILLSTYLAFFFAAWWLATHRLDRFLVPALPLAALLAGIGATARESKAWRWLAGACLVVGLTFSAILSASPLVADNRWFVALADLRDDVPAHAGERSRVPAAHRWLNENLTGDQAVLLVGDAEPFDLRPHAIYNTCFDDCQLVDLLQGKSPDQRRQTLASRHIAYVLVDWNELARYQSPGNYGYDPRFRPELIDELRRENVLGPPVDLPTVESESPVRQRIGVEILPAIPPASPSPVSEGK
jgi:hypothetical protein